MRLSRNKRHSVDKSFLSTTLLIATLISVASILFIQNQYLEKEAQLNKANIVALGYLQKLERPQRQLKRPQRNRFTQYFRELYKYQAPLSRGESKNKSAQRECGTDRTNFQTYFQQGSGRRSSKNEDKIIYETFFRETTQNDAFKYVELGAFDGMSESNSRFFDLCLGWQGLLIEANPKKFEVLKINRPQAHLVSFAASCSVEEAMANKTITFYDIDKKKAAQANTNTGLVGQPTIEVPCGSMTPLLLDLLDGHVHFLSLDVENAEPMVLATIDFSKVFIEVLLVESWNTFCQKKCESRDEARSIMSANGYHLFTGKIKSSDLYVHPKSRYLDTLANKKEKKEA